MTLGTTDREFLATQVRELLLCGHLIDRATMPHVLAKWGREVMAGVAIDEWMGASPIYTRRTQRLLGFVGDDVETIFKAMQFDIGAPPQFMDFRYAVHDAHHGEFHLDHCGALMDVEVMGPEYVFTMCHEIEDPTFDATAWATNPRARMRPIHRPPREPADREPHCAWAVTIDPENPALPEPEMTALLARTQAARVPLAVSENGDDTDGARDYGGVLVDDIDFAVFSTATLERLAEEIALQAHLLVVSGLSSIAGRFDVAAAREVGRHQLIGSAGITAERLAAALGLGSTPEDIAGLVRLHPLFHPTSYVASEVTIDGDRVRIDVGPCPALEEIDGLSWPALLLGDDDPTPLAVIAQALDPTVGATRVEPGPGAVATFELTRGTHAAACHPDVELARFSTGADFRFTDEGTRVQLRARRTRQAGPQPPES